MSYRLSVDSFDSTFAVKEDGSKLTHFSGKRFKLFPFIANNNSAPIYDLDTIVGRYISQIEKISPEKLTVDDLTEKLKEDTIKAAVQVNGKVRATIEIPADCTKEEALAAAKAEPNVKKFMDGKTIVKEIYVPGKILNFVVK